MTFLASRPTCRVSSTCAITSDYMRNKCGVQQLVRNRLVTKMFEDGGLLNADDSVAFTEAADALANDCEAVSSTFGQHFRRHVELALRQFIF